MDSMKFVKNLKSICKDDVPMAGGKGASLGEMLQTGLPIPPGYVILSGAFDIFLSKTKLDAYIKSMLKKIKPDDIESVEQISKTIREAILSNEIPTDIEEEIQRAFKNLDSEFVAVRSSATSEDSASSAWAGQLESYLNTTKRNLSKNVKRCWASLFTPRAIFYRFEKKLASKNISVAVVIQKMIESQVSGVAFSANPVTHNRNQVMIEAGFGLGEAVVSGQITPDNYIFDKKQNKIIEKHLNRQEQKLVKAKNGGNNWESVKTKNTQKLSDEQISNLSKLVLNIEKHYHFPCDIEWAFENGRFYITQSRPITTMANTD